MALYHSPECKSSQVYIFKTWRISGKFDSRFRQNILKFCLIILRNMSMLNQLPSSSKPCARLGESVWSMQNSSRHLLWQRFKMPPPECYQDFTSFDLVTYYFLPDMTHIWKWTRYYQYKHSEKVSSCWSKECSLQSINNTFLQFGLVS